MKTMTMGDYYVWYCEWCDSRNLTPWTRTVGGKVCCGGCHKEFPVAAAKRTDRNLYQQQAQL